MFGSMNIGEAIACHEIGYKFTLACLHVEVHCGADAGSSIKPKKEKKTYIFLHFYLLTRFLVDLCFRVAIIKFTADTAKVYPFAYVFFPTKIRDRIQVSQGLGICL